MTTTVMFIDHSSPLSQTFVRRVGMTEEQVFVTDDEGKVELDLEPGSYTFEIQIGEQWIRRTVERQGDSSLFVIDIRRTTDPSVSSMNSLQVDLTNLVGDRYLFESILGRGGMGVVVKAIDRLLSRPVAIKLLSDELTDNQEAQQLFLVEARSLATLNHPNLVSVHDILNVQGRTLMVLEYVLGMNLERIIQERGALSQAEAVRIAIQLSRCVSYLHEHELIHRDLKTSNVIVQEEGSIKLIDFGLARSLSDLHIRGTRVRGTPAYMAPEQIRGLRLTERTDIYQIGITFYEMLAGALPFSQGDMAYAHVHLDPPPLQDKVPGLDPALVALVHRCLSKRPVERPESMEEIHESLQRIYQRLSDGAPKKKKKSVPMSLDLLAGEESESVDVASYGPPVTDDVKASANPSRKSQPVPTLPRMDPAPSPTPTPPPPKQPSSPGPPSSPESPPASAHPTHTEVESTRHGVSVSLVLLFALVVGVGAWIFRGDYDPPPESRPVAVAQESPAPAPAPAPAPPAAEEPSGEAEPEDQPSGLDVTASFDKAQTSMWLAVQTGRAEQAMLAGAAKPAAEAPPRRVESKPPRPAKKARPAPTVRARSSEPSTGAEKRDGPSGEGKGDGGLLPGASDVEKPSGGNGLLPVD